jgi:hypothetical protein
MAFWSTVLCTSSEYFITTPGANKYYPSHQFQLTLGDYFKENPEAADGAANATDIIGWLLNHDRVHAIFDEAQAKKNDGVVLAYVVANLTRSWVSVTYGIGYCAR